MNQKGFTLFELLVVIVVLGIVAMLATPQVSPIFSNIQKNNILDQARDIERAARFYCGTSASMCEVGDRLNEAELGDIVSAQVRDDYEYTVTILYTGDYAVYYAKDGALSFPFNSRGYLATSERVPTRTGIEFVHEPSFIGGDYPSWEAGVFEAGDRFTYDDRALEMLDDAATNITPSLTNLENPDYEGYWQEVRIGDAFRIYNIYEEGQMVSYNNRFYYLRDLNGLGENPDTSIYWQEITNEWREFNYYEFGDVIWHNGDQYRALSDSMTGIEPGVSTSFGDWQNLTSNVWQPYNIYYEGDTVIHDERQFVALQDMTTSSVTPSVEDDTFWEEVIAPEWDADTPYYPGEIVLYDGVFFEAYWYNVGQIPSDYDDPVYEGEYVWRPVE